MIMSSALAHQSPRKTTLRPVAGSILAVIFLTLIVSCGGGDSSDPQGSPLAPEADGTIDVTSTAPASPEPTATPNVEVIEIVDGQPVQTIGGNGWWDSKAPVAEFRAIHPVLAGSPSGDAIWSLYAASFVASEWLSGREPVPAAFGPYVAGLTLEELAVEANELFAQITALDPTSAEWLRPYHLAETDEEFTLVVNLGFAACLSIATWDECLARASGG